jgi:hypothetical protein
MSKNEKHEIQNADSTQVPQKWLRERWYGDPKRKAIGASGKNVKIRVGAKVSPAYVENYDKVFGNKSAEVLHTNAVNPSRHETTDEMIGVKIESTRPPLLQHHVSKAHVVVFEGETKKSLTKWMDEEAVKTYHESIHNGLLMLKIDDSRHNQLFGPKGACWVYTTFLSNTDGSYTLVAHYRSMDRNHKLFDEALQWKIGEKAGVKVSKVILLIDSYHSYK